MDQQGMNQLICLILEYCSEIACLVDITINTDTDNSHVVWFQTEPVFSKLVTLRLRHMSGLEEVLHDPSLCCSLKNLKEIRIENCTKLYSISFPRNSNLCSLKILKIERCQMLTSSLFMPSIAQTLESLEELRISKCSKLKHIIAEDEEEGNADVVRNRSLSSSVLPKLRILEVEGCERLESIFPLTFAQGLVRLEGMKIRNNGELNYVFGTQKEHYLQLYQNANSKETNIEINLLALRSLTLSSLSILIEIWPESYHPRSPNLTALECSKCPRLSATSVRKAVIGSDMQQDTTAKERDTLWVVATNFSRLCYETLPVALQAVLNFKILILTLIRVGGILELQLKGEVDKLSKPKPLNSDLTGLKLIDLPELSLICKGPTKSEPPKAQICLCG